MWLACSTPRIHYHSLRGISGPWLICAGYNRHQTRPVIPCTVTRSKMQIQPCGGAISGHRGQIPSPGSTLCRLRTRY